MTVVTPDFVQSVIREGGFAEAQARARDGTSHPKNRLRGDRFSWWALICEDVLDTEHDADWYDDILAELTRRGISHDQIDRMRSFAWQTAGWLNYDKMLWEWVALDEKDIRTALDFQLKDGIITAAQHAERLSFIEHPSRIPALP